MSLKDVMNNDFVPEDGRICGVLEIQPENTLCIPDTVMRMFDLHGGDKMLLLADKKQGMALVKCSHF